MCVELCVRGVSAGHFSLVVKFYCGNVAIPHDAAHLTENITVHHCGGVV